MLPHALDSSGYRVPSTWRNGGGPELAAQLKARAQFNGTLMRGAVLNAPGHLTSAAFAPFPPQAAKTDRPNVDNLAASAVGGQNFPGLPGRTLPSSWDGEPGPNGPTSLGLVRPASPYGING